MKFAFGSLAALLLVQAIIAEELSGLDLESRITDGQDAYPGQFPYQVSIQWGIPPLLSYRHVCGGSIISDQYVLTAGHCVTSVPRIGKTIVKVGKHHITNDDANVQAIQIDKKIVHENFPGNVAPNDIALMKLKHRIIFNERVQPIKLPRQGAVETGNAQLSGWGSISKKLIPKLPQTLQHAIVPVVPNDECERALKALDSSAALYPTQMCSGPLGGSVSACSGDSGGPLAQVNEDNMPVIVGIVSWGTYPCGSAGAPSVYTRVSSFIDWINKNMREN